MTISLLTPEVSYSKAEEMAAIRRELDAIKGSEAEVRIPALHRVKTIATSSAHPQVRLSE